MKKPAIALGIVLALATGGYFAYTQLGTSNKNNNETAEKEQITKQTGINAEVSRKVWSQLSEEQKATIRGSWSQAEVSKTTITSVNASSVEGDVSSYDGKEVYLVRFPTTDTTDSGVSVYADLTSHAIIGYGLSD